MNSLRIAIAENEPDIRIDLVEMLEELDHQVVAAVGDGHHLIEVCREYLPDLVVTEIHMPEMDGLQAASQIRQFRPTPIVILSAYHDPELVDRALKEHVLAYLVKPIQGHMLKASIEVAIRRFRDFQALQEQTEKLQQLLEERKMIERAKGILMKRLDLAEADAFRRLQLLSSQKNKKMIEIARTLIDADQAFEPAGAPAR